MIETGMELHYFWLPVLGFVIGLLATMVGGNGAFFFPPALILLFQVSPRVAIATSLAAVIPIGLIGSLEHYRRGNINLPIGTVFGLFGLTGAFAGAWLSSILEVNTLVLSFGIYSILLGLFTLHLPKSKTTKMQEPPERFADLNKRNLPLIIAIGLVSGFVAGLYGTSGTAPVLAALLLLRLPFKIIIGTSVMIVFINAVAGFSGHLLVGEFDTQLIVLLGSGAAIGAFLGPRFLSHIRHEQRKENKFRYVLSALLIIMGVFLLVRFMA